MEPNKSLNSFVEELAKNSEEFNPNDAFSRKEETKEEVKETEEPKESITEEPKEEPKEKPLKEGEDTPHDSQDENVPFHKNSRWIKREKELQELRKKVAELEIKKETSNATEDVPDWWVTLAGDSEESKQAYNKLLQTSTQQALDKFKQESMQKSRQEQELVNTITSNLESIEEKFGIDLLSDDKQDERTEFLNYVEKLSKPDSSGNIVFPDFETTFELWQAKKELEKKSKELSKPKPNTALRKQVASLSVKSNDVTPQPKKKVINFNSWSWRDDIIE